MTSLSQRTLQRVLRSCNLFRRGNRSSKQDILEFVQDLLQQSDCLNGYRWMHARCIQQGFNVSREDIRIILSTIDSDGVALRRRRRLRRRSYFAKGLNFLWHVEGYDKLKPYGLCISGCIDCFSKQIVWL